MKILVVDDSGLSRKKITKMLEKLGHQVIAEAENGEEAVEKFKKLECDCVTMDLEMPIKRGDEAAIEMLKLNKNAKIVLITSIVDKKEILKLLRIGVRSILTKPIIEEQLKSELDKLN